MTSDLNKLRTSPDIPLNLITPNEIDTKIGKLTFTDGAPSSDAAQKILDNYDFVRALQVYMDAHQGPQSLPLSRDSGRSALNITILSSFRI